MNCLSCSAETTNGLALCERCRVRVAVALEYLPVYFGNLARWRPGRGGSRQAPASREPRTLGGSGADRVSRALDEAGADLGGWARVLADDRPGHIERVANRILSFEEGRCFRLLCAMFERHLTSVATTPWVGDFVTSVEQWETTLRELTEDVVPGWYGGACKECGAGVWVVPGFTWVTCEGCGATTAARDRLDILLAESRGWVAPPKPLAEVVVAMTDEASVEDLRKRIAIWAARERITTVRPNEYAVKRHRLGEVLDRLATPNIAS